MITLKTIHHSKEQFLNKENELIILKLLRKLNKIHNKILKRGRKSVTKHILNKKDHNNECILLIPLEVSPLDIITHLPYLCKEKNIPYFYLTNENIKYFKKLSSKNTLSSCCLISFNSDINRYKFNEEEISNYNLIINEIHKIIF